METLDYVFSFSERLIDLVNILGPYIYAALFTIVFAVSGIILTPFLPGNSLLFIGGTLAGSHVLNIWILYLTILSAAVLGNIVNYWVGYYSGDRFFNGKSKMFNKKYLDKTRDFYDKHGGKAIIFARFFIALRTYAPFVAGMVKMPYRDFLIFNILGALIWSTTLIFGGYFFGGIPIIRDNFEKIAIAIIVALYGWMLIKTLRK